MRYLAVVTVYAAVYILSGIAPYPSSAWFFVVNAAWSLLVVSVISRIMQTKIIVAICILEIFHIINNLSNVFIYIWADYPNYFIYIYYEVILATINAIEMIILIYGVPWSVIRNRVAGFFGRHSSVFSGIFDNSKSLFGNRSHIKDN